MWRTPKGERTVTGVEAELLRDAVDWIYRLTSSAVEYDDPEFAFSAGIRLYDQQEPAQQLALLSHVGEALLVPEFPAPPLTATREATVAALYSALRQMVDMEIDMMSNGEKGLGVRENLRQYWLNTDTEEEVPDAECDQSSEWMILIDAMQDAVLWDEDWDMDDLVMDSSPEKAAVVCC